MFVSKCKFAATGGRRKPLAVSLTLATVLVAGLTACEGSRGYSELRGVTVADASARHPIIVSKEPVHLDIEVPRGSSGLTRSQKSEVRAFVSRYRTEGEGGLTIAAPSGGRNEYAVVNAVSGVRHLVQNSGVSDRAVRMEPYYAGGGQSAPIKVSFVSYVANPPKCGRWPHSLTDTDRNEQYTNFGCAQQQNLAAAIVNPRDLLQPRGTGPRSSTRRDQLYDKWVKGEETGANKSEEEQSGSISNVAN